MKLSVSPDLAAGRIKPMNAVNNGPFYTENGDQNATNLPAYRAARIPFARTHDAAICYSYGGSHIVDVVNIFPDFDADPEDPAAYDFTLTDEYLRHIAMAGTEVFYRLGNAIEHWSKHYGILPPKDFHKWAVICEHIIRHYNEGWADGLHLNIRYWEIWNEPDLEGKCWGGTAAEFYDLFVAAAKHLKACFPDLHIGGPAVCGYNEKWLRSFFERRTAAGGAGAAGLLFLAHLHGKAGGNVPQCPEAPGAAGRIRLHGHGEYSRRVELCPQLLRRGLDLQPESGAVH